MSRTVKSTCPYCGVGCGLLVGQEDNGRWRIEGDPEHPSNRGRLCSKGTALNETLDQDGRLLAPMIDGRSVTWERALERVAEGFRRVMDRYGPDAVAFYVSGQLLTEDYYVANKLMKGFIGSANIDTNSRLCMASSVAGHQRAFGADAVPGCYEDFDLADLIILVGSNTAWCHPVLYRRIVRARELNPLLRVVVIDPRETATCEIADLHLPLTPGSDSILFSGLLAWLDDNDHIDLDYVADHTEGAESALHQAHWYSPTVAAVAQHCGLESGDVQTFFHWFGATSKAVTLYSQGINQTSSGSDKVNAIINCHLLTGRIGRPGMGPFSMTGQPNAMGGREVGALSNQLACHMELGNQRHADLVQRFWGSPAVAGKPGLKAVDLFRAVEEGRVKALWVMATNPAVSMPDASRVRRALRNCQFVVVSDNTRTTDTTLLADVLLPASGWGEKDGTVTSSERTISRQRAFLPPAGESRPDWWIVSQVAGRLGFTGFEYQSAHEIFCEHARLSGFENGGTREFDISGLAELEAGEYELLQPIRWPVPTGSPVGTARLFSDGRFATPTGLARFVPVVPRPPGRPVSPKYPLVLNTGRIRDQWHTMTRTGKSARLSGHDHEPFVAIHPEDARRCRLMDGELVRVLSHWGEVVVRGRFSEGQRPGQLFVPMHWNDQFAGNASVGCLVNPVCDPISGQPEFKHTPVAVEPYRPAWHGFLLSRKPAMPEHATYWARARRDGLWHYELAGDQDIGDWPAVARTLLPAAVDSTQWAEMLDSAVGHYRGVSVSDDRLQICLFIGPDHRLPRRDWLVRLFSQDSLSRAERLRLLAGTPDNEKEDGGETVCACFNVGINTLVRGISEQGLHTAEAIGDRLKAGTNCGSCLSEIKVLIARHAVAAA